MTDKRRISRRTLLAAGVGSLGFVTVGGNVVARAQKVSFNRSQQIPAGMGNNPGNGNDPGNGNGNGPGNGNGNGPGSSAANENANEASAQGDDTGVYLQVDWKEWYNGEVVEAQDAATRRDDDDPGVLTLPNIMPGDRGRVTVGLSTATDGGTPPAMEILFRIREPPGTRLENGRNEPEEKAGDTTDDTGELQELIDLDVWYDTGVKVAGNPIYGFCDAEENPGDTTFLSGSLAELSVVGDRASLDNDTWHTLEANASNPVDSGQCLQSDEGLCLTIEWTFTSDENVNRVQGDSVSPVIEFGAIQCS